MEADGGVAGVGAGAYACGWITRAVLRLDVVVGQADSRAGVGSAPFHFGEQTDAPVGAGRKQRGGRHRIGTRRLQRKRGVVVADGRQSTYASTSGGALVAERQCAVRPGGVVGRYLVVEEHRFGIAEGGDADAMIVARFVFRRQQNVRIPVGTVAAQRSRSDIVEPARRGEKAAPPAQRPLHRARRGEQIDGRRGAKTVAAGRAGTEVEDVGQTAVVTGWRPAPVERGGSQERGLEPGHQSSHVKRGVHRRAIEKHELHVGGGAPQVEHVGGAGGVVAGQGAHRRGQRRIPHPGGQVERLDLQFRYGPRSAGLGPGGTPAWQPVGPDLDRVKSQRPAGQLEVDAHGRVRGQGHFHRDRLVPGMAHANGDHAVPEPVQGITTILARLHPPAPRRCLDRQQGVREYAASLPEYPGDRSVHGRARGVRGALGGHPRQPDQRTGGSGGRACRHDNSGRKCGNGRRENPGRHQRAGEGDPQPSFHAGAPAAQSGTWNVTRLPPSATPVGPATSTPAASTTRYTSPFTISVAGTTPSGSSTATGPATMLALTSPPP